MNMTRIQGLLGTLGIATVTAAFTVALFGPRAVTAVDEPANKVQAPIVRPELRVGGCVFTLAADRAEYEPGQSPVLTLRAENPTVQSAETKVLVQIAATRPVSLMARRMPIPKVVWSHEELVGLGAGETKSIELATKTPLEANQHVTITLSSGEQKVVAAEFGVALDPQAVLGRPDQSRVEALPGQTSEGPTQ
jgi:hypothetical protein